jgi:hypothetical protein
VPDYKEEINKESLVKEQMEYGDNTFGFGEVISNTFAYTEKFGFGSSRKSSEMVSPLMAELVNKIKETPTLAQSEILTY